MDLRTSFQERFTPKPEIPDDVLILPGENMDSGTKGSKTIPPSTKRKVELLADTPYSIEREGQEKVVLRNGKSLELWCQVKVPHKGYAIRIGDLEYEFDSKLDE